MKLLRLNNHTLKNTKFYFLLFLFLLFCLLSISGVHSKKFSLSLSRTNINELIKKIQKSFPNWIKKYIYIKKHPEVIEKKMKELNTINLPDGKEHVFQQTTPQLECDKDYDVDIENVNYMKINTHEDEIKLKICKLKSIIKKYPNLTDKQIFKIAYFIGNRKLNHFRYFMDAAIDSPIGKFIEHTKDDNKIETEYTELLHSLLIFSSKNTNALLSTMTKVQINTYLNLQEKFKKYFDENDMELFEGAYCKCYNKKAAGASGNTNSSTSAQRSSISSEPSSSSQSEPSSNSTKHNLQYYLNSIKTNIDYVTSYTKPLLNNYKTYTENFYKSEKYLDKLGASHPVVLIRQGIKQLENDSGLPNNIAKFNEYTSLTSLMIKIEQGKATPQDILKATEGVSKILGVHEYIKDPIAIGNTLLEIRENYNKMINSKSSAVALGHFLLIVGNTASLSKNPLHQKIGKVLVAVGTEINSSKAIQGVIDSYMRQSVDNCLKDQQNLRLGYFTQFYSDFAMDDFVRHHIDIDFGKFIQEYKKEKEDIINKGLEPIKNTINEMTANIAHDISHGNIDRYSRVGSDFDTGFFYNDVEYSITNSIVNELTTNAENVLNYFNKATESVYSSDSNSPSTGSFSAPGEDRTEFEQKADNNAQVNLFDANGGARRRKRRIK